MRKTARGDSKATVLVVDTGLRSGPWACRSLTRAGYRVLAGNQHERSSLAGRCNHALRVFRYPSPWRRPDEFLETVEAVCRRERVAAVLPLSETTVHLLARDLPRPAEAVVVGPTYAQYEQICDKGALRELAARAAVGVPEEVVVTRDGRNGEWPRLPSIVKPRTSATPTAGRVLYRTATVVRTPTERDSVTRALVDETGAAVVQEEIRGYRWLVEFVRGRRGLAALPRLVVRSYPPRTGPSSVSRVVDAPDELVDATARMLDAIDYRGPGNAGFLVQDGRFLVHDINLRVPFSVAAAIEGGLDLPRLAVEEALGGASSFELGRVRRHTYVWLTGESKALADAARRREAAAPAARIAADVVAAALSPRRVLDPPLWEPLPLAAIATAGARSLARRAIPPRRSATA